VSASRKREGRRKEWNRIRNEVHLPFFLLSLSLIIVGEDTTGSEGGGKKKRKGGRKPGELGLQRIVIGFPY